MIRKFIFYKYPADLEQDIMSAWGTRDDIDLFLKQYMDGEIPMTEDDVWNILHGIQKMHELRCQRMWDTFEGLTKVFHKMQSGEKVEGQGEFEPAWDHLPEWKGDPPPASEDNVEESTEYLKARITALERLLKTRTEEAAKLAETAGLEPSMTAGGLSFRDKIAKAIRDLDNQ